MSKRNAVQKSKSKEIAKTKIDQLLSMVREVFSSDKDLADRYVKLARDYSKKHQIPIPSDKKKIFCKHCYKALMPGVNLKVRTNRKKRVVFYCMECKKTFRHPYIKEKKSN